MANRSFCAQEEGVTRACLVAWLMGTMSFPSRACDLCAIYSATGAGGQSSSGFLFTIAEQFTPFHTAQFEGERVSSVSGDFLDSSFTHFVPGYNFSPRFGVSLNVPLIYRAFQRSDIRYSPSGPPVLEVEHGSELGLGDVALIGRLTAFQVTKMKYGVTINFLAGVKFPTGDTDRIDDEVNQTIIFESLLPPGTPHDPLGHSISGLHQHDLSPGSGSFDGIFGITLDSRWDRWFFNAQGQYYLRTEARSFQFGNDLLVSGGPGAFLLTEAHYTLNLQAVATYESSARDEILGRKSDRTGMTAWFAGPQVRFTWTDRFSAQVGADIPIRIANNGFQYVPDYRFHGGASWRF